MIYSGLKHQPKRAKVYLEPPNMIRLDNGMLVASHDYFGDLRNMDGATGLSSIYRSENNDQTWSNVTHLIGAFLGTLFLHKFYRPVRSADRLVLRSDKSHQRRQGSYLAQYF